MKDTFFISRDFNFGEDSFGPPKGVQTYPTGYGDEVAYHTDYGVEHFPRRTKYSHPYSYDPIVSYTSGKESTDSVYSDRLYGWDSEKYNLLAQKHFKNCSQLFYASDAKKVQAFLREYLDDPKLVLTDIVEMCNASNGYPVWLFQYRSDTK